MTVWIDLDNSPHVPFFAPIIDELEKRGYSLLVTARDCFQVCDLARLMGVECKPIGRHSGKNKVLKIAGLCQRSLQLLPTVLREKPALAVSHGSRAQLMVARMLGLPSMLMMDYEFARGLTLLKPGWVVVPEHIPGTSMPLNGQRILKYPGIKEDVYARRLSPDPAIVGTLGLAGAKVVVTIRPPATEAHYHVEESDVLFRAAVDFLSRNPDVKMVMLPRNTKQEAVVRRMWPGLFDSGRIVIPAEAVDGLNLIWHSDLVISGGGTMNREAAAIGVPVYSVFRGTIGAVDRYLAKSGRMILLESEDEVRTKISLVPRTRAGLVSIGADGTLSSIVGHITSALEGR